jgi:hypothetical protein
MEKIRIKTVQDIFDTVNLENIDRFMLDFYKIFHSLSEAHEGLDKNGIRMEYFDWTDDGENKITLHLKSDNGSFKETIKY